MVDIVSHANVATEHDAVLKRHQNSSSASSAPAKSAHLSQNSSSDAVAQSGTSSDVRLEVTKIKNVSGYVYKLIDKKSGEVVRQWPTEQIIKMREYLAEQQIQLVDEKA
ncbi:MAG TPA: flagellar protein FlaG [Rhizomicrobium sp.]|jgi:uncharacterized FlaG/YvyC family protein|nr:flagellar protein FlaG [Rhizomicrobium sp.]